MLCTEIYAFGANLFAQLFYKANENLFHKINEEDLASSWLYERDSKELGVGLALLNEAKNEKFEDIEADFTRLFICDEFYLKAPPYASFYYSKNKEIVSENSILIAKTYAKENFTEFFSELPADSVVNELLFLSFLFKRGEILPAKRFLEDEILPFIFHFAADVKENADTKFYKAFGYLLEDFFNSLKEEFDLKPAKREIL